MAGKSRKTKQPGSTKNKGASFDYIRKFEKAGIRCIDHSSPAARRHFMELEPGDIPKAAGILAEDLSRFITISALSTSRGYELLYHFHIEGAVLTLKTVVPKRAARIESIASRVPAAELVEHEIQELLGVEFPGNPRKTNFLLPEDWPDDKKPLKRDDETLVRMTLPLAGRGEWRLEK